MPTMIQTVSGTVTGLWGKAMIRGADGKMRPLQIGDLVVKGDVILTSQDGIVQLNPDAVVRREAARRRRRSSRRPAGGGSLLEGLRVGRISEGVNGAEFQRRPQFFDRAADRAETPIASPTPACRSRNPTRWSSTRIRCCRSR